MSYLHFIYQIDTISVGSYPCSSLDIEVDREDARFGEVYLLWHNLSAWRKVSDILVGCVEHLDYTIVITSPDMSVWRCIHREHFVFAHIQLVDNVRVIFEDYLCQVVRACQPENSLV